MKKGILTIVALLFMFIGNMNAKETKTLKENFPDGAPITEWFADTTKVNVENLGTKYIITDYGVKQDSTILQTKEIQKVIDLASQEGGGVVVIPKGVFLSGSLFFKKGTHLHLEDGAKLKGSDAIKHYKIIETHFEGLWITYFAALVNADGVDGFTITGKGGTIDGNGLRYWEEFWIRRKINPKCTNLEAMRPRLVYISNCNDVTIQDVSIINSAFWSNHLYRCNRVKYLDCNIISPLSGTVRAPSSDGIDLDVCTDVLVRGCYINVCDDGVCLKGGRGTFVDSDSTAGRNENIIVENCTFGKYSNSGITFGSDSWYDRNVILRNCAFENSWHIILFKMRPDTPQNYEYVRVENCTGSCSIAVEASTWTQFHSPEKRDDMPISRVDNIIINNVQIKCSKRFLLIKKGHEFTLSNFSFENIDAQSPDIKFDISEIVNCNTKNITITKDND